MKVGFIGTGNMGNPMANNILSKGHELVIHDVRREQAENLLQAGATWANSAREVAEACTVVLTSLPTPGIVEAVYLGEGGLLAGAQKGSVLIDLSTNSPTVIKRIAALAGQQGVRVLDGPVSGGTRGARRATLAVMVGGDKATFDEVKPILDCIGQNVFHVGDIGMGNVAKLVNNMIALTNMQIAYEALVLGTKAGMDPQALVDVIRASSGNSFVMQQGMTPFVRRDWRPSFTIDLSAKDVGLAVALGRELKVPLVLGALAEQELIAAQGEGLGEKDITAMITRIERAAGVEFRLPDTRGED
ncbi:MAG TPA: NAD(P)-dependent oxidoreductase [Dehalococcoidia bacterium]|nr:NAD(P)-dependent oxidoreductase [Dehalococcoidia bacterium]